MDGSPAVVRYLRLIGGVETPTWVARVTALSRGSATRLFSEYPRGPRMALKDYSDNKAVRSRGQDLVSTEECIYYSLNLVFVSTRVVFMFLLR